MNKKLITKILVLGMCIGILSGCSKASTKSVTNNTKKDTTQVAKFNPDTEKDTIEYSKLVGKFGAIPKIAAGTKIGDVEKTLSNEYWQALAKGYTKKAKELGVIVDVQAAQNENDQAGQLSIAETMISKKYAALLVSPQTDSNLFPAINEAKQNKVPVVNVDDALAANADVFVGNIQKDNGVNAAKYIADKIGGKGQVACIEGQAGVYGAEERTAGFKETIAKSPNVKLVSSVPADWDRQKALDAATNIMNQYPDLKAFYCNNDGMALGVVEAVKNAGKLGKIIIIGTDGTNAAYESIKKGELTGTVDSFAEKTGEIGLEVAIRLLGGQKIPRVVITPQALVTKENMAQYAK